MRGLQHLIRDIRNCKGKEGEQKRVNKELANIRKQFTENKNINGYKRKKYVCKLVYIYMLGYEVDVGFREALNLLSSSQFSEKQIGYLALGVLLNEEHQMIPLVVQSLSHDLAARSEYAQCLALTAIANIGGKQMAEAQLAPAVTKLLLSNASPPMVKKKAAICLLQLFRKYPDFITPDVWAERLVKLLNSKDPGVVSSLMSLLIGIVKTDPTGYEVCIDKVIEILGKIVLEKENVPDYIYYHISNPWLQVKLLRFLRYFPPPKDETKFAKLHDILYQILNLSEKILSKSLQPNQKNSLNCVLFEAIDLVIRMNCDEILLRQAAQLLGRFLGNTKESANVRYLALEAMANLFVVVRDEAAEIMKKHQEMVIHSLKDADISIRRRALDLLYGMCDKSNAMRIVSELLNYLIHADFDIQEELVLKIAILAEKFASNYAWYVDTILRLISLGGENVPDDIWYRAVQIVTNHEDIQEYACVTVLKALKHPSCGETTVKVAGYLLGEFGHLIADKPESTAKDQLDALHSKFHTSSLATRALLLSTYVKLLNLFPDELGAQIKDILQSCASSTDAEIQQRAYEYLNLTSYPDLMQTVLDVMPPFAEPEEDKLAPADSTDLTPPTSPSTSSAFSPSKALESLSLGPSQPQQPHQPLPSAIPSMGMTMGMGISGGIPVGMGMGMGMGIGGAGPSPIPAGVPSAMAVPAQSMPVPVPVGVGLGAATAATTATTATAATASTSSVASPIGSPPVEHEGGGGGGGATSEPAKKGKPSPQDLLALFRYLCVHSEGLLYEDAHMQIGLKSEFQRGMGRVMLYYGNTSKAPITQFATIVSPVNYLAVQVQELPSQIAPLTQEQQLINVSCISEFQDALSMQVSFLASGKSENLSLRLPIVLTKFVEPTPLNSSDFFMIWKSMQGAPCEHQSIFKAAQPIDLSAISNLLFTGFRLAVLTGVDPNTNNLVASGTLFTTTKQVPVLLRLETNAEANMIRLSVRTSNGQVTASVKNLICAQLMA
jgi:AP-2 complex subunit alpha